MLMYSPSLNAGNTEEVKCCPYLVLHGFLLANQLGAQDQHLLLADVQLLTGGVELIQEHLVGWGAWSPSACSRITQQALPHLCQVVFQLLVLRLQLLTLRGERHERYSQDRKWQMRLSEAVSLVNKTSGLVIKSYTCYQGRVLQDFSSDSLP